MIFGNQTTNQDDAVASAGAPAAGSFLVGGASTDPVSTDVPMPADIDDDTATPAHTLDQPPVSPTDSSTPTEPSSSDATGSDFSSIIAPADRDIPAVVHASVKSSLINDRSEYDEPKNDNHPASAGALPDDLLDLKQQALGDLSPLVDHLDQTPEEKFRTTMMLIQSTDNSALIKEAYAAAQAISDDKIRAQALLDVINEINYFTQQSEDQPE